MAETQTEADEPKAPGDAQPWLDKIKDYQSAIEEKWAKQRENLDKLYSKDDRADSADREYSIFWANIEVLRPAVYARTPVPVVAPRFKQPNQIASAASETLERCLVTTFEQSDLDGCMREVRDEFLRYARGTAWARLAADPERVEFDHVAASDYAHDPARTWREVEWVARKVWMKREPGVARFGEAFRDVPLKRKDKNSAVDHPEDQAPVWEMWCRTKDGMYVKWIAEDHKQILDEKPAFLQLSGGWPCPKPAYGTTVPGKLKPVPDIRQYKDQIEEINEYTARISALSEQLRLKGFYPAGESDFGDAIEAAIKNTDNRAVLVPISSWAALGGNAPKDSIVWLPIEQCLSLVTGLVELRRIVIDDVYQITGISDIVRGQTDAAETATAQQIKSQWGSIRIRERQNELQRFARDMTRIAAEIISENFQPQTIIEMAQMQDAQGMEQVLAFLRNDRARGFVIEIETDSTIQPDEDAEKQRRVEFVTSVGGLFQQAAPIVMQAPQLGPFIGEVLKFAAAGFRAGRPLEGAIDNMVQMLGQAAQQAMQPKPPDPKVEAEKATTEMKLAATKATTEATVIKAQASVQQTQANTQAAAAKHVMTMEEMAARAAMPPEPPGKPN